MNVRDAMKSHYLGALVMFSDVRGLRQVERAMRNAKGSVRDAAEELGVTEKTLHGWLRLPQLAKAASLRQGRAAVGARSKTKASQNKRAGAKSARATRS